MGGQSIILFIAVGFLAQMIDGALGMGYGVISTSMLLGFGAPPALASAGVHMAEVFTTGISGLSHFKLGNVEKKLFLSLLIPGVLGGVLGAYVLTRLDGDVIKPFVAAYLLAMGLLILYKALRRVVPPTEIERGLIPLALAGGFMDATGGGGWGPIVTSTLVARGHSPRFTIGSVNAAEFFVTVAESVTFILALGSLRGYWQAILGLLIGGILAAPLAAYVCRLVRPRTLMILVGILIVLLSLRTIYLALV